MDMHPFPLTIIRSRRRTIGLHIGSDAQLTVRAPMRASQRSIDRILAQKHAWILAAQDKMRRRLSEAPLPIPARFLKDYKRQAQQILSSRVQHYATQMQLKPSAIKVNSARRRWGSCSRRGNLNFSYRLIFAPLPVIDYVVVHELTHMHHLNHSRAFWDAVAEVLPDFRKHHRWLKEHGHRL